MNWTSSLTLWAQTTRGRLVLLFGGAAVVTGLAIGLLSEAVVGRQLVKISGQALMNSTQPVALALAQGMHEREREIAFLSDLPALSQSRSSATERQQLQAFLDRIQQSYPLYSWIGVTDEQGRVRVATGNLLVGQDVSLRPWFSAGAKGPYVGDAHDAVLLDKLLRKPGSQVPLRFMDFASPVRAQDSTFQGVVAAHVNGTWMQDLIERSRPETAAATGLEILLVNTDGVLDPSGAVARGRSTLPSLPPPGNFGIVPWGEGADGRYLTAVVDVPSMTSTDLGWKLVARQPLRLAMEPVYWLQILIALAMALMAGTLVAISYWAARHFSAPIEKLAESARHVETSGTVGAMDFALDTVEFRQLGAALRHMTQALLEQRQALARANEELETRVQLRTQALQQSEQRYLAILEGQSEIICRFDNDNRISFVNDAFCRLFGIDRSTILGQVWVPVVDPQDLPQVRQLMGTVTPTHPTVAVENRVRAGDGSIRWCHFNNRALFDDQGCVIEWQSVGRDITELKLAREKLHELLLEQEAMLNNDLIGIAKVRDRTIVWRNPAMERILGYAPGALQGRSTRVFHDSDADFEDFSAHVERALAAGEHFREQHRMRRFEGDEIWVDINGVALADGGESLWLMQDITAMKRYQEQVEHIAFHDHLTDLPNRLLLADRMTQALAACDRQGTQAAVCFMDLNGFKPVNDAHGHDMGDLVLRTTARRIRQELRSADTAARVGGDEFVVLLAPIQAPSEIGPVLERIRAAIEMPIELGAGLSVRISSAFGVAVYPDDGRTPAQLLRKADEAMYADKGHVSAERSR